jgi:hypothetical protein
MRTARRDHAAIPRLPLDFQLAWVISGFLTPDFFYPVLARPRVPIVTIAGMLADFPQV